jgi:hypothetical protein
MGLVTLQQATGKAKSQFLVNLSGIGAGENDGGWRMKDESEGVPII